jgi:hypothetical protein
MIARKRERPARGGPLGDALSALAQCRRRLLFTVTALARGA